MILFAAMILRRGSRDDPPAAQPPMILLARRTRDDPLRPNLRRRSRDDPLRRDDPLARRAPGRSDNALEAMILSARGPSPRDDPRRNRPADIADPGQETGEAERTADVEDDRPTLRFVRPGRRSGSYAPRRPIVRPETLAGSRVHPHSVRFLRRSGSYAPERPDRTFLRVQSEPVEPARTSLRVAGSRVATEGECFWEREPLRWG